MKKDIEKVMLGLGAAALLLAAPLAASADPAGGRGSKPPAVNPDRANPRKAPGAAVDRKAPPTVRKDKVARDQPSDKRTDKAGRKAESHDKKADQNRADTGRLAPKPTDGLVDPPKGPTEGRDGKLRPVKPEPERRPLKKTR